MQQKAVPDRDRPITRDKGFTDKMSKSQTPNGQNVERQNVEWDKMPNAKM